MMRTMNILLSIALTTGILSGLWGWVAVSLGLLSWAGFLGCTAYFACPQGGIKGLLISACTVMSGVVWAQVIIHGAALAPHLEIFGYVMTGMVAFLMCMQAKSLLLSFVPGTFIGACATFAGQGGLAAGNAVAGCWFTVWICDEKQRLVAILPARVSAPPQKKLL